MMKEGKRMICKVVRDWKEKACKEGKVRLFCEVRIIVSSFLLFLFFRLQVLFVVYLLV